MCGIFGIIASGGQQLPQQIYRAVVDDLFRLSESRGKEASGMATVSRGKITVYKAPLSARVFIRTADYARMIQSAVAERKMSQEPLAVIGHTRLATHGSQELAANNQPVAGSGIVGVHNGIITNDKKLWQDVLHKKQLSDLDSEVLPALLHYYRRSGHSWVEATQRTYQAIEGSASVAFLFDDAASAIIATNTGSLFLTKTPSPSALIFASEAYILRTLLRKSSLGNGSLEPSVRHVQAGSGCLIDMRDVSFINFPLKTPMRAYRGSDGVSRKIFTVTDVSLQVPRSASRPGSFINSLRQIKLHDFDYRRIAAIPRCRKCLLPVTMPFIRFDQSGVCQYCRTHTNIRYHGRAALERRIAPYRRKGDEPDCIVAFSGGRDSSYGLHYVKKELGMTPIAYTYDWGMVTDLARRNEARLVGKLGAEHIIVAADIPTKLKHIRQHILAWMKKPNLGMVPLFMEGDKQCEYYAYQLMKKTGIQLVIYCRGNELENEDFKHGHAGIRNPTPSGVIHNLSLPGKLQIASYYGLQYLANPSYINSSLFDTAFAYFSTFMMRYDFVYLWHYIPWEEKKIIPTLKQEYGWETDKHTKATWRTDDGTAAFYNYIYAQVQGFTENDTFRSNQIREGVLGRKEALSLVPEENRPRHEALTWYFDRVGLDGHEVLSVVDAMPKLY